MPGAKHQLIIVADDALSTNISALGAASVAAFVARNVPGWSAHTFSFRPDETTRLVVDLLACSPSVVGLWLQPECATDFSSLLSRVAPGLPGARFVFLGPTLVSPAHAEWFLTRHPQASAAVWGEPEATMAAFCSTAMSWHGTEQAPIPSGLAVRRKDSVQTASAPPGPVHPEHLPSPFAPGHFPPPRPGQTACLEIARGPIPFSPLPLDVMDGPIRPLPIPRIRQDFEFLLEMAPERIALIPDPADINPVHLRWVLRMLGEIDHALPIALSLKTVPDSKTIALLHRAGVTDIVLEPDLIGARGDRCRDRPDRDQVARLVQEGFHTTLRLVVGHPEDDREAMERWFDYHVTAGAGHVEVIPAALWPGHPFLRAPQVSPGHVPENQGQSSARNGTAPPVIAVDCRHHIVTTAHTAPEDLARIRLLHSRIQPILATFPASLRALANIAAHGPSRLVERLARSIHDRPTPLSRPSSRRILLEFGRRLLQEAGKVDRRPPLEALIDFEYWKTGPHALFRPRKGAPYRVADLEACVLQLNPGQRWTTFPYDVLALEADAQLESAAVHPTHLLCRRHRRGVVVLRIDHAWRRILARIDGRRTVRDMFDTPGQAGGRVDPLEVRETVLRMLEAEVVHVKRVETDSPRVPGERHRVLPFRRRTKGDERSRE